MRLRALRDFGALRPTSEVLGVAAGAEATLFWLTNHVRRVVATDLYDAEWGEQAPEDDARHPGRFASCPWNPRRLVVERMDALDLRYADSSFESSSRRVRSSTSATMTTSAGLSPRSGAC